MKYVSYKGTPYEKKVAVPEKKKFGKQNYDLADVFPNYGGHNGHKTAKDFAGYIRGTQGHAARVVAYSGFTAVYAGNKKKK
jgi:hypothetical protein